MIDTITTHEIIDTNDEPDIKVIEIGGPQTEHEQKRRRRRRRRRPRSKITSCSSDDSTCATVSLSSDDLSTATPPAKEQPQRKKNNQRKSKKQHPKQQLFQEITLEEQARYLAMDCEMVGVGYKGRKSSVARVTLVDWNGRIVYDEFVQQDQEVTDYRTFVSGITPLDVEDATLTLEDCKRDVQDLIADKILVGHALKNDMRALGLTHPWTATRDTAKYEPFMQTRFDDNVLWPRKLKELAREKLQREIQRDGEPHSAYEDAAAAMDLYRSVRRKWEKVMDYKIQKTLEINTQN
jgi:RNA exonuclease 4